MATLFQLAVGLGIFLYGMYQLEGGAKELSGRRLRSWLLQSTQTPLTSALSGTALTTVLQSSSLVGLIILAFASAGAIPLTNAIGVLLGANLGTTLKGWMVTFLGFTLDLENYALPMIALGGVAQILLSAQSRWRATMQLVLGLGLLLFGLELMKNSVATLPEVFSIASLQGHRPFVYLLAGVALTAVIQSSSAMMMLTLAALNSQLITLPEAAAIAIGADLGTTSTVLLGSMTGQVIKRQLAMAHLIFNLVVDLAAFFILLPFLPSLLAAIGLSDPLYGLVAFHSLFNVLGLLVFLPFLNQFALLLTKLVKSKARYEFVLANIPVTVPAAAMPVLDKALQQLVTRVILTNATHFNVNLQHLHLNPDLLEKVKAQDVMPNHFAEDYEAIKVSEGDILAYIARLQQLQLTKEQTEELNRVTEIIRAFVYNSKTLKDIRQNLDTLEEEEETEPQKQFQRQRDYHRELYAQLLNMVLGDHQQEYLLEECDRLIEANDRHQKAMDQHIYQTAGARQSQPSFTSTQLNVNREIHHAAKNLLRGLKIWIQLKF